MDDECRCDERREQQIAAALQDLWVPLIPEWVKGWGAILLIPTGVAVLWAAGHMGQIYGADLGWLLLGAAAFGTIVVWWMGYCHRLEAARVAKQWELSELHQMTMVDNMSGAQFETYSAQLLMGRGYHEVEIIGSTIRDQGVDIIAINPYGAPVAVQCKRQKNPIGPDVIRNLIGAINSAHSGRDGILMTSARVTDGAKTQSDAHGIEVIDRSALCDWVSAARSAVEECRPGTRTRARFGVVTLSATAILLIFTAFHTGSGATSAAAKPRSHQLWTPSSVIKQFFAAINRHEWRRVWQLGGKNLGHGPYASYRGMVSGYRLTERDVITGLKAEGNHVSGRLLAHETTGAVQVYKFRYVVRGEMIVAGRQDLLATRPPKAT